MKKEIDIAVLETKKIIKYNVSNVYSFDVLINEDVYNIDLVFKEDNKELLGIVINVDNFELVKHIVFNMDKSIFPSTLNEYYNKYPSTKYAMVTWNLAGGNSGKNAVSNKVSIPKKWLDVMDIKESSRDIIMKFDGTKITIEKRV